MDNGNNFFKATLSIVDYTEEETASPKTSGVNMIIPLAVVPDIAENYANVSKVVKTIEINKHENIYWADDVKMFRICNGQQGNSSKFPCGYCLSKNEDLLIFGQIRTIGSCMEDYNNYIESGKGRGDLQELLLKIA